MTATRRVAVVTGAGRGIGLATAERLAAAGHDLALCAREADEVRAAGSGLERHGIRCLAAPVDVADPDALHAFLAETASTLGPIDVLVNNAGTIHLPDGAASASAERWDATVNVNARAVYLACGAVVPGMVERGFGRIVNVASTAGLHGLPARLAYTASKHAVVGLTRALSEEVRNDGVTVNAVCPGAVVTRMTAGSRPDDDRRGWLQPDDVARTILHLASDAAAHVHGAIVELRDRA